MKKTMKERLQNIRLSDLLAGAVLAGELAVLLDVAVVLLGATLSTVKFAVLFAALFLLALFVPVSRKFKRVAAVVIVLAVGLSLTAGFFCWRSVSENVVYNAVDDGKAELYGGQRVMLLVPHQDDEINVLGGVIEEYVKYGSEVYVVFSTNGDYFGLAETRFREALDALEYMGVPADHAIFLGYGDQWNSEGPHIYNAAAGQVLTSEYGSTQTYGTQSHEAWREGTPYTIDNFLGDIEDVILTYEPDVLYCVDYDYHIDHRALTLAFEKVMGRILKERKNYRPRVYKGYAYNTGWEAVADFYGENLLSTQYAFAKEYDSVPEVYRWEDRVRLPVHGESLSRSVASSRQNTALSLHASQDADLHSVRIINSDKVFWRRSTESLCYDAEIRTSSGAAELLNDFMLLESGDLLDRGDVPYDGAWVPAEADGEKQAAVTFPEPRDLYSISLYDHPDPEKNVRNAVITFDDGTVLETGPLDPGGAETIVLVEKTGVTSFTVTLAEMEGEAGLTEIEAFGEAPAGELPYIKLMDGDGNFAYDYWIDAGGSQSFYLYASGVDLADCILSCDNAACSAVWDGDTIVVTCPEGERCVVSVTCGTVSDSVFIQNPGTVERGWKQFWLRVEAFMGQCKNDRLHKKIFVCRVYTKVSALLQRLF